MEITQCDHNFNCTGIMPLNKMQIFVLCSTFFFVVRIFTFSSLYESLLLKLIISVNRSLYIHISKIILNFTAALLRIHFWLCYYYSRRMLKCSLFQHFPDFPKLTLH